VRIGSYEVVSEIGRGGVGVVLAARSDDGRAVAIKTLNRTTPQSLARFERETRLLGSLGEAEGFVPLLDAGAFQGCPYLVMPLLTGGTLRDGLKKGPLDVEAAIALGVSLAGALARAHERGIVHRDLKPENVLFTGDGRPLVSDLGLAKHFDEEAPGASQSVALSQSGTFLGTAGYMAPEQGLDAKSAGPEADVFSLGAILYECLAGRPAFQGSSALEVIERVEEARLPSLRRLRPEVPRWLERVLSRALARDPRDRYPFAGALESALVARSEGRSPWVAAAGALALVLVLGGVLALGTRARPGPAEAPVAAVASSAPARPVLPVETGTSDGAIADREPAVEVPHGDAGPAREAAFARARAGDFHGAIAAIDRALELDPGDALTWATRGDFELHLDDRKGAIADYARAIERDPKNGRLWYGRGRARAQDGDLEGIADLTRAIDLGLATAVVFMDRGLIEKEKGDVERALADLTRAIELDPENVTAIGARAEARLLAHDLKGARLDLDRAIELDPGKGTALANRGTVRALEGDHEGAIADLTRAIACEPGNQLAWQQRASSRKAKGDLDGALSDLAEAIRLAPGDPMAHFARALALSERGDAAGALAALDTSLRLNPDDPKVHALRGRLRFLAGDRAGAFADLRRGIELNPKDVYPALWLAGLGGEATPLEPFARGSGWASSLARLLLGKTTREGILADADAAVDAIGRSKHLCEAFTYLGVLAERAGDQARARKEYEACVATKVTTFSEYDWAKLRLR
jgi:tetratricopeptide (TPR) repeat protein